MSILYNGNYRIIDLQKWHLWFTWLPIRITEGGFSKRGKWRWLYTVERKVDQTSLNYPRIPITWEYRDIGARWVDFDMPRETYRGCGDGIVA